MPKRYPFAALVGQDDLKLVLILNAIYPSVGGVLIRGEKGTAKSTIARALAELLPSIRVVAGDPYHRDPDDLDSYPDDIPVDAKIVEVPVPFVDLPIGATEDRVLGSLDLEAALKTGARTFHPGLLAAANRGILYIDEINLLPSYLVDILLDAAAMGVNTVQREGISLIHPSHFILIGTMNPEEGDLRPQLLDRFGLMIDVAAPRDLELRSEVVRRRIAFETAPAAFIDLWTNAQASLRSRIQEARLRLNAVTLDDAMLRLISRICIEFDVDGMRADLALHKTARALAAWEGRVTVNAADIQRAAQWVLPHRRRRQPFEPPDLDKDRLDQIVNAPPIDDIGDMDRDQPQGKQGGDSESADGETQTFTASKPHQIKQLRVVEHPNNSGTNNGKRNAVSNTKRGHYVRAVTAEQTSDIAVDATLRSAALNGKASDGSLIVTPDDLHLKIRASTTQTLILFVVDASGTMAAQRRMEAVKGAVLALLTDAYQQRDLVAVIAFRGTAAELILSPTHSVELAEKQLRRLPTGGRTPLAHALILAQETLHQAIQNHPNQVTLMILLSDGKANVPLSGMSGDPWRQTQQAAANLAGMNIPSLVLDTETGFVRLGRGRELAECLRADYLTLDDLSADTLMLTIRQHIHERSPRRNMRDDETT